MPEVRKFRCNNCGHRFDHRAATEDEREEARRQDRQLVSIHCPKCKRTDIRQGWE